jgi:hypothetical protein
MTSLYTSFEDPRVAERVDLIVDALGDPGRLRCFLGQALMVYPDFLDRLDAVADYIADDDYKPTCDPDFQYRASGDNLAIHAKRELLASADFKLREARVQVWVRREVEELERHAAALNMLRAVLMKRKENANV